MTKEKLNPAIFAPLTPTSAETVMAGLKAFFEGFTVTDANGQQRKARIVIGTSEGWHIINNHFELRDEHDKLILPAIAIVIKGSIKEDFSAVAGHGRAATQNGYITVQKKILPEGQLRKRNKFYRLINGLPDQKVTLTANEIWLNQRVQDSIFIRFDCDVIYKCQYIEELFDLQAQFYRKTPARTVFNFPYGVAFIKDAFRLEDNFQDRIQSERKIEATISLDVTGWIIPELKSDDSFAAETPSISFVDVGFDLETSE